MAVVGIPDQEAGIEVSGEDDGQCRADRIECRDPPGQQPGDHDSGQHAAHRHKQFGDEYREDLVGLFGWQIRPHTTTEDPERDVEPHHCCGDHRGEYRGHLHVPLASTGQHPHRLAVIDDAIGRERDDPAENHQPRRHALLEVIADVGHRQLDVLSNSRLDQRLLHSCEATDLVVNDPPHDHRSDKHHDRLDRIGQCYRLQPAG